MKKFIVIAFMALAVTMIATVPAKASDVTPTETPTPTPEINAYYKLPLVRGDSLNINNLIRYYNEVLDSDQQKIVRFLLGSYNFMYLTARGFSYENVDVLNDYILKFDEISNMILSAESLNNSSRWNSTFQVYLGSIITYAGNISEDFDTWLSGTGTNLIIPYTNEALDAWTTFYNDPSNEGIADFGSEEREWSLGIVYSFLFNNYPWNGAAAQTNYNNFILNESPVMYTNEWNSPNGREQYVVSFKDVPLVDTIYVLRSAQGSGLQHYRFGFYDGTFTNYDLNVRGVYYNYGKLYISLVEGTKYDFDTHSISSPGTINDVILDAVNRDPIKFRASNANAAFTNWYIGLTHVVLVDDLYTLANRQDVNNDYTLGIITDNNWISRPVEDMPYWWKPINFEIEIEKPNGDLDPPEPDQLQPSIVNNTVINNYEILAPGSIINVPVDWLDSDGNYLDYTNTTAIPFFVMIGDIFNALGEIRIFIIAVLILGLAGGVLVKFLL